MFSAVTGYGISGRAFGTGLVEIGLFNPRSYASDRHRTVDDRPYGGGPGMVMMVAPLREAISAAREWAEPDAKVVYLSPQGSMLDQQRVNSIAVQEQNLVLVAGRYEGVDERLLVLEVDEEWSIGDYVLSGGELAAMVLLDAVVRQLPGVLGHDESAAQDSFAQGLLDCPHYTRPEEIAGQRVPDVLLSGNHEEIRRWRLKQSLARTAERRPDLMAHLSLNEEQRLLLMEVCGEDKKELD